MSTRSYIAIENKDKTITTAYCHFDGYISGNGKTLLEHYQDKEKIHLLISGGSFRALLSDIKNIEYYDSRDDEPVIYKNEQELLDEVLNTNLGIHIEYIYLFKEDKWFVLDSYKYKRKEHKWCNGFIELATLTKELNDE